MEAHSTRRAFVSSTAAIGLTASRPSAAEAPSAGEKAFIAITLDLEMSRNFPTWEQTHWDYEKGNLDAASKRYAVEAARRVKARGGVIHFFALGQTMEQADVGWLREIIAQGHPVGNHTYDHVNINAARPEDIQFRFKRAPWLIEGKSTAEVIAANIHLAESAFRHRLGITPAGFRTPGGFHNGLADRPDLQAMLRKMGYSWVSSQYPAHPITPTGGKPPDESVLVGILAAQRQSQPFVYPSGLVELPMSPISDVTAFRTGRWPLDSFLGAIWAGVHWAIEQRAVFSFLAHPSCLGVVDPSFRTIDLICERVRAAADRAEIVDLDSIARGVSGRR
jgi:peptidoglycan/xylan/chitin deacetylase (PgdA/CDA1 family)